MKFTGITMKNFMRYKGLNTIEFSCAPDKNVTVVLGDNTVGKTTIAQAFRWGLYGAVLAEKGKRQEDYQLLNNDILAAMDANSRAEVFVEISAEDEEKHYMLRRIKQYTRMYPQMVAREASSKVELTISDRKDLEACVSVEPDKIDEVINEMFPRSLSHYFLFDGERWNDVTVNGVRESIKESVHILTGLSTYQQAIWHLKDMGSNSVIKKARGKISGSGNFYDQLEHNRKEAEREVEQLQDRIKNIEITIENNNKKSEEIEHYLEENRNTEAMQGRYKNLQKVLGTQQKYVLSSYKNLVDKFSEKAAMLFARPMIDVAVKMVQSVEGERRDIPHMHQSSIDYILKTGKCLCGTEIKPDSKELECLLEWRNYLPPADIGSLLGEFERTGKRWRNTTRDTWEELTKEAENTDRGIIEYEETINQIAQLERQMDERIDFAEKRAQLKHYQETIRRLSAEKGNCEGRIEDAKRKIANIESEMQLQEAKNEENARWRRRVDVAEALYERLRQDFEEREKKTFQELNTSVQENFERMFNAKDKKIQLTNQYEIQMLYRTDIGFREEKNLSEGEKIARNFAFIVTIMEYSREKKAEKLGTEIVGDTLPIVLDGPFSKLGDENIRLIAKVLPEVSEQVILFMLDKDWKYTELDPYVGAAYRIEKAADEAYASIKRVDTIADEMP